MSTLSSSGVLGRGEVVDRSKQRHRKSSAAPVQLTPFEAACDVPDDLDFGEWMRALAALNKQLGRQVPAAL